MHVKNWDTRKIWSVGYFILLYFIFVFYFYLSGVLDRRFWGINYFVPPKLFLIAYLFWLVLYGRSSWQLRIIDFFVLPIFLCLWFIGCLLGTSGVIAALIEPGIISLLILAYYFLRFILKERYMGSFSPGIILIFLSIIYYTTHYFLRIYCTLSD